MNSSMERSFEGLPGSLVLKEDSQPYYICVPPGARQTAHGNRLYQLCGALNALGYPAYLDIAEPAGDLWTPTLTESTRISHHKAGKKPAVVCALADSVLKKLGLQIQFHSKKPVQLSVGSDAPLQFVQGNEAADGYGALFIPACDLSLLPDSALSAAQERSGIAFINKQYLAAGGKAHDLGASAVDLMSDTLCTEAQVIALLCKTRLLHAFEESAWTDIARLCGCAVVMVPNAFTLKSYSRLDSDIDTAGIAWSNNPESIQAACDSVLKWRAHYLAQARNWEARLLAFIETTQHAANALSFDAAWPEATVDSMDIKNLSDSEQGARADRVKYRRVNKQFERWSEFCTLREIDADIYAEHLASGRVPGLSILIDQRGASLDSLADTLDSLGECLWRPTNITIVSSDAAPDSLEHSADLQWIACPSNAKLDLKHERLSLADWTLLLQSGVRLASQSLVEWGLATSSFPNARLIYADEDTWQGDGKAHYPFFKPDANIELLRCSNYLGSALLARTTDWARASYPLFDGALYCFALELLYSVGREALGHIDTVLVHGNGLLPVEVESLEYNACSHHLQAHGLAKPPRPLERLGNWLVEYPSPGAPCVSLVVATGLQTGYLRTLLESLVRFPQPELAEVVLVCEASHEAEVQYILDLLALAIPVRVVACAQDNYSHALALNAGVQQAQQSFVLVCDDDTEGLHAGWLGHLLGIAQQTDVGCVAPRLMTNQGTEARVSGGPLVLGVAGAFAPYNGEQGLLTECGVHSRLQLTQDVSAVAGHCFLFRKSDWEGLRGFDTQNFPLFFTVLDFCLRLSKMGKRHVWTPLSNVLHQGGKTLQVLMRDARKRLNIAEQDLSERESLLRVWAQELANDRYYNRHLSLARPFDVESTIVVDWHPRRHDRPKVLACPLTSGAGQYRIVEPLNMLQDAGLAQTCAVIPERRRESRALQPLELVRAAPDRLILQHAVDDAQLDLVTKYRLALPQLHITQMVDDLLGEVPEKHPNRNFQVREGHQRMTRALKASNRVVVTTETLRQHYQKYVSDVRIMPNCLDKQWSGLRLPRTMGRRLRVGWIGAGQHKGDLELITQVVQELAHDVDWVFMGMCTDEIKPLIKEYHDFVSINEYPKKMASLDLDIAIAPLESNFFNDCKSNLRLLEYGAMGWPVVCSDVYPYRTLNPPVIRCSNDVQEWTGAIRRLMSDHHLRHQMGSDLHQWVESNFLLKDKAQAWMQAIFDEAEIS